MHFNTNFFPKSHCSELHAIIGFWWTKVSYFGNSVAEIYMTQEDYKPVIICVHIVEVALWPSKYSE